MGLGNLNQLFGSKLRKRHPERIWPEPKSKPVIVGANNSHESKSINRTESAWQALTRKAFEILYAGRTYEEAVNQVDPVRIAHILPFANIGGTEQATLRLAEAASRCGFENILFCPDGSEDLRRFYHRHCFLTGSYQQVEPSYHRPLPYLQAARSLACQLRRHRVRIVHCADILAAHYAALAGRLAGAFVLSQVRCQHSGISRRDQTFLLPVQKFVFVSRDTWNVFGMKISPAKGEILYDGLPEVSTGEWSPGEARTAYGLPANAPVVGMAARVHPGKDFETLITAAKTIVESVPKCKFLIAGDHERNPVHRDYYAQLKTLLRETGLDHAFLFSGFESQMSRFFAAIDIFVLSTHAEGLPLVVLEAMAQAKPTVATDVGGIGEIITNEQTGLLVAPKSPEQLTAALLSILTDRNKAEQLAGAGRERIRQNFSKHQFQTNVRHLYCGIVREQGLAGNCSPCLPT